MTGLGRELPMMEGLEWWQTSPAVLNEQEKLLIDFSRECWATQKKVVVERSRHGTFAFVPVAEKLVAGAARKVELSQAADVKVCREGFAVLKWLAKAGKARSNLLKILRCAGRMGQALMEIRQTDPSTLMISSAGKAECLRWLCNRLSESISSEDAAALSDVSTDALSWDLLASAPEIRFIPSALGLLSAGLPKGTSSWLSHLNAPAIEKAAPVSTQKATKSPFGENVFATQAKSGNELEPLENWLDALTATLPGKAGDKDGKVSQLASAIQEALSVGQFDGKWACFTPGVLTAMSKQSDCLRSMLSRLQRHVLPELRLLPGALLLVESFCKGVTRAELKPERLPPSEHRRCDRGRMVSPVCEPEFRWFFDNFLNLTRSVLGDKTLPLLTPVFKAAGVAKEGERLTKLLSEAGSSNKDYEWHRCVDQARKQEPDSERGAADLANQIFKVEHPRIIPTAGETPIELNKCRGWVKADVDRDVAPITSQTSLPPTTTDATSANQTTMRGTPSSLAPVKENIALTRQPST